MVSNVSGGPNGHQATTGNKVVVHPERGGYNPVASMEAPPSVDPWRIGRAECASSAAVTRGNAFMPARRPSPRRNSLAQFLAFCKPLRFTQLVWMLNSVRFFPSWKPESVDQIHGLIAMIVDVQSRAARQCEAAIPAVDVAYIDADHSYDAVKDDISAWYPRIAVGGALCGHDYHPQGTSWPGVRRAVDEFAASHQLRLHTYADSSWMVLKTR